MLRLALSTLFLAGPGPAAPPSQVTAGEVLARAHCAECHSLNMQPSPLADAPPFWSLYRRVPAGGRLEDLLTGGMIAPQPLIDGQAPPMHPRMPQVRLDDEQIADLLAFLRAAQRPPSTRP